jgi:hypothetical protein
MENQLSNLFQQMGDKSEKLEMPDLKLKDAVFSTVDATSLIADIVDLFTFKFLETQTAVMDSLPNAGDYGNEKQKLFKFFEKKFAIKDLDAEDDM